MSAKSRIIRASLRRALGENPCEQRSTHESAPKIRTVSFSFAIFVVNLSLELYNHRSSVLCVNKGDLEKVLRQNLGGDSYC